MNNIDDSGDLALAFDLAGQNGGEPVVLLHAIGTDRFLWDPQWEALCAHYKVIRCDLPGHGKALLSAQSDTMFTFAEKVAELIDRLGVGPVHIIGSSLGGMIGLALAIEYPENVRSLIAADVRVDAPDQYKAMWEGLIEKAQSDGMGAISEFMIGRWFGEAALERGGDILAVAKVFEGMSVEGFVASARAIQQMDFADRVGKIKCPTLLVVGENDGALPELMLDMSNAIQGSRYVEIKDAGHLPNIDRPDHFTRIVQGFLEQQC